MTLKCILTCAALAATASFATPALATVSEWTLSGVTFDDGGTAYGTFTYDSSLGLTAENIVTTDGSSIMGSDYTGQYASATANDLQLSNNELGFFTGSSFYMQFASPLVAGGTTAISFGDEQYVYYDPVDFNNSYELDRFVTAGSVSSVAAVPEPGAWAMALIGFAAIGLALRSGQGAPTRRAQRHQGWGARGQ